MASTGPGPAADQAFTLGLVATTVGVVVGVGVLFRVGLLSVPEAVLALVLGLPVVFILAACVLGVWLGYDEAALSQVAAAAAEQSDSDQ